MGLAPLIVQTGDASAIAVHFIGSVLVVVAAAVFGYFALLNLRLNRLESQRPFWRYLTLVGASAGLYGLFSLAASLVESRALTAFGHGALLLSIVFLAFSMREVYYNSAMTASPDDQRFSLETLRRLEAAFVGIIVVEWVVVLVIGQSGVAQVVKAFGSVAFAAYGGVFAEKLEAMARGTSLDTLRRHLVPVLVSLGVLGVTDLGVVVGIDPVVVQAVENVFVVLVSAFLITATIRLQQNVEGLSPA